MVAGQSVRQLFGDNVRRCRRALGLSRTDLAVRAKIPLAILRAIEDAKYNTSIDLMERIANVLEKPLHGLFYMNTVVPESNNAD